VYYLVDTSFPVGSLSNCLLISTYSILYKEHVVTAYNKLLVEAFKGGNIR
jgi:hypothetical protein